MFLAALPTRFATTNFLIDGGVSQSWMIDNRIITITTSGCTQKELKDGVCDKCYLVCRKQREFTEESRSAASSAKNEGHSLERSLSVRDPLTGSSSSSSSDANSLAKRRRHVSAFAGAGRYDRSLSTGGVKSVSGLIIDASSGEIGERKEVKDDLHLEHKLNYGDLAMGGLEREETNISSSSILGGSSPFISEYSHKTKVG